MLFAVPTAPPRAIIAAVTVEHSTAPSKTFDAHSGRAKASRARKMPHCGHSLTRRKEGRLSSFVIHFVGSQSHSNQLTTLQRPSPAERIFASLTLPRDTFCDCHSIPRCQSRHQGRSNHRISSNRNTRHNKLISTEA